VKNAMLFGLMALVLASACSARSPQESSKGPEVALATVTRGSVEETVALAGRVGPAAATQVKLAFGIPGNVQSIDVRMGEHVDAGEPLARLDATPYAYSAAAAGADAQAATEGAALARVDRVSTRLRVDRAALQRAQRLYHAGVVALRDVQAAQATLAADSADASSARAGIAQAQAQARSAGARAASANYDVSRTTLRAPASGVVAGIFAQTGDTVDVSTPVVALSSADQSTVTLDVPINDVPRIATGDEVRLHAGDRRWTGHVEGVGSAVDPVTGLAVVTVAGVPSGVPAGTPVEASVVIGAVSGIVVPRSAVIEDPQTGHTLVFVHSVDKSGNPTFESREVTIDAQNDRVARVASGVHVGERVAAQGAIDLLAPAGGGG
jgi:multidrug efflux pump subunit AcrA (membrane-fusion protein)